MHKLNAAVKKDEAKIAARPKAAPGEKLASPAATKKKVVTEQEEHAALSGAATPLRLGHTHTHISTHVAIEP